MDRKLRIYFNEFNIQMGKYCYLPIVSGILRAYAETDPIIKERCEFMPFLYKMDSVPNILAQYDSPNVAAFSVSMWNEQLNLAVAREVKKRWPNCLIVFGGYQVPHDAKEYMREHKFIDICATAAGEESFRDILSERLRENDWNYRDLATYMNVSGTYARHPVSGEAFASNNTPKQFDKDLDQYPSPYLSGVFDKLLADSPDQWQAIIETNRGCNWPCSFCAWGRGGLWSKFRFHSMERVKEEIDWMGRNKITYVFNADSNFGQHPRDMEIAQYIVETKKKYGYPDKFRTCFGKNTDEKIFAIGTLLHENGLEKGITLARQSNDEETLKNIRRQNIKLATYRNLQARFNDKDVPVYSELILGLPGETVESWKKGIDELLTAGLKNQLFVYLCQILPNTELSETEYRKKHGIESKKVKLTEIHGSIRDSGWVDEYEEIVIGTNSMPYDQWREMCKFSWLTMLLHSMKAGFFVLGWLWDRYQIPPSEFIIYLLEKSKYPSSLGVKIQNWDCLLDDMSLWGESRGTILNGLGFGDIYWDVEEAALLCCSNDWDKFYRDLTARLVEFLRSKDHEPNAGELYAVMTYQRLRMPEYNKWQYPSYAYTFPYNVAEYFEKLFGSSPVPLETRNQMMFYSPKQWNSKEQFARETVLWGRKSGTMLVPCSWENV